MSDLIMKSGLTTVEVGLKNTILYALGSKISPAFVDVPTARAFPSAQLKDDELAFITSKGFLYQFNRFSTSSDDGDTVLQPSDSPTAGRWIKTVSKATTGYAKAVRVHAGEESYQLMLKRAFAQRPSIHIIYDGTTYYERSMSKGALYRCVADYKIRCIASSLRNQAQDIEGSSVASETDPGTHNMIGDTISVVAGSNLNVTGVDYCEVTIERYAESDLAGRLFVEQVDVRVYYSIQQPDSNLNTIDSLSGLMIQRQLMDNGYDANNLVLSGYTIPVASGLTQTPVAGTATINSTAVSSSPTSFTFTANKDTYRDLHTDGTFSYTAVSHGFAPPAIVYTGAAANTMRVGVTVTDGSNVIWDRMLCPTKVNFRAVDIIPAAGVSVSSIAVTPSSASFSSGQTQKFTATATYTDGRTADISTVCTWASSNTAVATIDYTGTATWTGTGTTTITCSYDGLNSSNSPTLTGN